MLFFTVAFSRLSTDGFCKKERKLLCGALVHLHRIFIFAKTIFANPRRKEKSYV